MPVEVKRVYARREPGDGYRVLVDRIWPRGLTKTKAGVDLWLKEVAPSAELRRWFQHDPAKWPEFRKRYFAELKRAPHALAELLGRSKSETVTLLFAAKDEQHNNAVALKEYLQAKRAGVKTRSTAPKG